MAERLLSAANAAGDQQAHSLLERCRELEKASADRQTATAARPKAQ
jgi:ferritin-like metal-binding protein YciE